MRIRPDGDRRYSVPILLRGRRALPLRLSPPPPLLGGASAGDGFGASTTTEGSTFSLVAVRTRGTVMSDEEADGVSSSFGLSGDKVGVSSSCLSRDAVGSVVTGSLFMVSILVN